MNARAPSPKSSNDGHKTSKTENFKNVALGIAGVLSSIMIPIVGLHYAERQKNREIDKGFVELGIKILSEKPVPENRPLREWAAGLINNYSEVKLNPEALQLLLERVPLVETGDRGISPQVLDKLSSSGFLLGVNVSHFNRDVDYAVLKSRQIRFVYVKASQGEGFKDSTAAQHASNARRNGLYVGFYHFFVPTADPIRQADNFITELKSKEWNLPPVVDCEPFASGSIPGDYATRVYTFVQRLQASVGQKPIIYTTAPFANQNLDERFAEYPVYLAKFIATDSGSAIPSPPRWWTETTFWHLTDSVKDSVLKQFDIAAFKGEEAALKGLLDRQRVAPN